VEGFPPFIVSGATVTHEENLNISLALPAFLKPVLEQVRTYNSMHNEVIRVIGVWGVNVGLEVDRVTEIASILKRLMRVPSTN
jgi:hypothetical protein